MKYQTASGMRDLLENDLILFNKITKAAEKIADFYRFKKIETPLLENSEIFEKGTGLFTDIVEKEMFSLVTKGGDRLTLRPEFTPSVVRSYIENGMQALPKPVNLWYAGPCFRYERPQAGRFRQFYQLGFETLGAEEPVIDSLIILVCYGILDSLGIKNLTVQVNSIGCSACRPYFKKVLVSSLKKSFNSLCQDCKKRLKKNPLRVLDCKEEKCERIKRACPQILDHLCRDCHNHFKALLEFLESAGIPFALNPYLVRGLDYYTKTVFEISQDASLSQGSLGGGGRYDDLVKLLGGKPTPACGAALGIDRIALLLKKEKNELVPQEKADVFLAQVGELAKQKSLALLEEFRKANINLAQTMNKDSLSGQLKMAAKLEAKISLIFGHQEALKSEIILREMSSGKQKITTLNKVVAEVKKQLKMG